MLVGGDCQSRGTEGFSRSLAKQIRGPMQTAIFHFLQWGRSKSLEQITKKLVLFKCQETLMETKGVI